MGKIYPRGTEEAIVGDDFSNRRLEKEFSGIAFFNGKPEYGGSKIEVATRELRAKLGLAERNVRGLDVLRKEQIKQGELGNYRLRRKPRLRLVRYEE